MHCLKDGMPPHGRLPSVLLRLLQKRVLLTENALYFAEEVMPAIDRKKNVRVRDRDTIRIGLIHRSGIPLSSQGEAFAAAVRNSLSGK